MAPASLYRPRDRLLHALLLASVVAPALAVAWGEVDGEPAFILYREPKLIAAALGLWAWLAALSWGRPEVFGSGPLAATLRRPAVALGGFFVGWLAATGLWVEVRANYFYELSQYSLLFVSLVVLLTWTRSDAAVPRLVASGLIASLAAVTLIGLAQLLGALPFLLPIDPQIGIRHPSLMGYKNPAALAVGGQVFLLAHAVSAAESSGSARARRWRIAGGVLLAAEVLYLASLGSRTAYLAVTAGTLYLLALRLLRRPTGRRLAQSILGVALVVGCAVALAASPKMRSKVASMAHFVEHPLAYLDSDRGAYLLNTVQMVRHHPLGVGLGDWQTQYPVYRRHQRETAFTDAYQVRRAHSDHFQILGEAGWPGAILWAAWLAVLIGAPARAYLRTGAKGPLFVSAQVVFFAAAMATDYVLELPYDKLQFFLVAFLALAGSPSRERPSGHRSANRAVAVLVTTAALSSVVYHASLARKVHLSATLTAIHHRTVEELRESSREAPQGRVDAARLERVLALGRRFDALPGFSKTFHKDYLVLGHAAYVSGSSDLAAFYTRRSLELHPYYPNALKLMSRVASNPRAAREWELAYDHVMQEATAGFERAYPEF